MDVPEMMKAQVFYEPEQMTLEEKAVPEIGPEQVLVKVHATGICGSDVAYYSETDGDFNESSNKHVAALSDVSPDQQNSIYEVTINQ